ncbi:MAG TPA: hypothetical protein VM659_28300, partial [Dongiaceae bacterium]|nr:hypothetical protein [Dongiaceae bacterium]
MTSTSGDIDLTPSAQPIGSMTAANTPGVRRPRRPRQLSIVATLALSFGGLMVVAMGVAIALLLTAANKNTRALIATNGQLVVDMVSQNLRYQLDPTESQLTALGRYILTEPSDLFQNGRLNDLLLGTLA